MNSPRSRFDHVRFALCLLVTGSLGATSLFVGCGSATLGSGVPDPRSDASIDGDATPPSEAAVEASVDAAADGPGICCPVSTGGCANGGGYSATGVCLGLICDNLCDQRIEDDEHGCPTLRYTSCIVLDRTFGEPNDTEAAATTLPLGSSRFGIWLQDTSTGDMDHDVYGIAVPAASLPSGLGYLHVTLRPTTGRSIDASLADSRTPLARHGFELLPEGSPYLYATVGAGLTYFLGVSPGSQAPTAVIGYDLATELVPLADTFEPNDTRAQARTISGTIQAYAAAPFGAPLDEDWYGTALPAGSVTVGLTTVPARVTLALAVVDGSGSVLSTQTAAAPGGNVQLTLSIPTSGTYFLHVTDVTDDGSSATAVGAAPPARYTQPYTLSITQ